LKKIEWFKEVGLAEIYQSVGMFFAFATKPDKDGNIQQCHTWVKCRDFLHDAVRTQLTGNKSSIYSFIFEKDVNPPIDVNKTRMLIGIKLKNGQTKDWAKECIARAVKHLNYYEKLAKISLTKAEEVDPAGQKKCDIVFLFVGPVMWITAPSLVSMHTLLARLGVKEELDFSSQKKLLESYKAVTSKHSDNDSGYLRTCGEKMVAIIKNRKDLFPKHKKGKYHEGYFDGTKINSFHDKAGIVNTSKATSPFSKLNTAVKKLKV
jgi:hypothetical protein